MHLYEITPQLRKALDAAHEYAQEHEGALAPEVLASLDAEQVAFEEKAEAVALRYRELTAEVDAVTAEADRLAARAETLARQADGLKAYLLNNMQAVGMPKIKGKLVNIRVGCGRDKVVIADGTTLPAEYMVAHDPTPNVAEIGKALKSGKSITGCSLERTPYLVIR